MDDITLKGKNILITGAARRLGRIFALACARAGADIIIHHGHSDEQAQQLLSEVNQLGRHALIIKADLSDSDQIIQIIPQAKEMGPLFALINSAAIFEPVAMAETSLPQWEAHLTINLTAPYLLSQMFARQIAPGAGGHIINILDWRALRPGSNFFPYTISKAALAAMTKSLAVALSPNINVNGLALGAILPPENRTLTHDILKNVPAGRWGKLEEIEQTLIFLLTGPRYITGEIIHLDGGRHLI